MISRSETLRRSERSNSLGFSNGLFNLIDGLPVKSHPFPRERSRGWGGGEGARLVLKSNVPAVVNEQASGGAKDEFDSRS